MVIRGIKPTGKQPAVIKVDEITQLILGYTIVI